MFLVSKRFLKNCSVQQIESVLQIKINYIFQPGMMHIRIVIKNILKLFSGINVMIYNLLIKTSIFFQKYFLSTLALNTLDDYLCTTLIK